MRNLTESDLAGIEQRADLWFRFNDRTALRPEDVADLIAEVRAMHADHEHLTALYRQASERNGQAAGDAELSPP